MPDSFVAGTIALRISTIAITLLGTVVVLAFFAAVAVPRATPLFVVLAGLVAAVLVMREGSARLLEILREPAAAAILVFSTYLFINSGWALDRSAALGKSGLVLALSLAILAVVAHLSKTGRLEASRLARFALGGLLAGLAMLSIEVLFGQPILKFVLNNFSGLVEIAPKHVSREGGKITTVQTYVPNRNVANAVILFWPAVLLATALTGARRYLALVAIVGLTIVCAAFSASGTAIVALGLGTAAYIFGRFSVSTLRIAVITVWVAGMGLAIPLGAMPYKLGWTDWTWLPQQSVAARFYIWHYTAEKARQNIIGGIGVRGTRELQKVDGPRAQGAQGDRLRPRPGRHAHNAFLQIWLELGAIGAVIFTLLGVAALVRIGRLERRSAVAGYALFVTICGVAAFGFGIWQSWLLAGVALSVSGLLVGIRARMPDSK